GRLLLPTLHLGQVAEGDTCQGGNLAQGAALAHPQPPQNVTEQLTQQDHQSLPPQRGRRLDPSPRGRLLSTVLSAPLVHTPQPHHWFVRPLRRGRYGLTPRRWLTDLTHSSHRTCNDRRRGRPRWTCSLGT